MIFFFTGTGNSLYAAKKIAESSSEKLINITDAIKNKEFTYEIGKSEVVGFVFPVYFYGLPVIISDFLRNLRLTGNHDPYTFLLITCGSSTGSAANRFKHQFEKTGVPLKSSFTLAMADNYVLLYEMPDAPVWQKKLVDADIVLKDIIKTIMEKKVEYKKPGIKQILLTGAGYPLYLYGRRTAKFHTLDRCTSCGLCARICPIGAIEMSDGKPKWTQKQCIHCLACIHRCPNESIQYGEKTLTRRRFVNPILLPKNNT
jgi:ferredoxin/flavodoxin